MFYSTSSRLASHVICMYCAGKGGISLLSSVFAVEQRKASEVKNLGRNSKC